MSKIEATQVYHRCPEVLAVSGEPQFPGCVMAEVHFTSWLRELVPDGPLEAGGGTVGDALAAVFEARPLVRGYVLDDRGRLRKHVCIFVDGARLKNDGALAHAIGPQTKLHVMQALSGG